MAFVPRLQAALTAKGIAVEIANAGVSGDTASDGLARLDWSVPQGTDAVIVELGANDMLRGINPEVTRDALDTILRRLTERHIAVLLCGMRAAPNLGADYGRAFERIYPDLAAKYGALLYPFFLDGVAANLSCCSRTACIPTRQGSDVIVERILPKVEELIARVRAQHPVVRVARVAAITAFSRVMTRERRAASGVCHAPLVHRSRNPAVSRPVARHDARRPAGRALDRSRELSSDAALHRRHRRCAWRAKSPACSAACSAAPFELRLDGLSSFGGRKPRAVVAARHAGRRR